MHRTRIRLGLRSKWAEFQGQLDPDPDHHFPAVDLQIFNNVAGNPPVANMQGLKSYFNPQHDVNHSHKILYHFPPGKLPVLNTLATEFALLSVGSVQFPARARATGPSRTTALRLGR